MWYHPDLSELVTKGRNTGIKMDHNNRLINIIISRLMWHNISMDVQAKCNIRLQFSTEPSHSAPKGHAR